MIVKLNVGGVIYYTSSDTLSSCEGYLNILMKNSKNIQQIISNSIDENGCIFIDRNGTLFKYILDFLRNMKLSNCLTKNELIDLKIEADFYMISELINYIEEELEKPSCIIASVLPSNNGNGAQYYKTSVLDKDTNTHVDKEWPLSLPIEQRSKYYYCKNTVDDYDEDKSEKISLYWLNKGYKIIDTIIKNESFISCSCLDHGPVNDTACDHSHIEKIIGERKYHILCRL